jgi:hypothetical protein
MRQLCAGLLALAILCVAYAGPTVRLVVNGDGSADTAFRAGTKPTGGSCAALTDFECEPLGTATCDISASDSNTATMVATSANEEGNGCVANKTAESDSNLHVEVEVPAIANWTGNVHNFAGAGVYFRDATGYQVNVWWPRVGPANFKTDAGGAGESLQDGGSSESAPQRLGLEYNTSTCAISGWESADGLTYFQIGTSVTHCLTFPVDYGLIGTSHSTTASTGFALDNIVANTTLSFSDGGDPDPGDPVRHVRATADFESGELLGIQGGVDGFWIATLEDSTYANCNDFVSLTSGGFGPSTDYDAKVRSSVSVGGATVSPRSGDYFWGGFLDKTKDYSKVNGASACSDTTRDKPRYNMGWTNSFYHSDWDQEFWIGFSVFLPADFEHEHGVTHEGGAMSLFSIRPGNDTDATHLQLYVWPTSSGANYWNVMYTNSATSMKELSSNKVNTNIGLIDSDLGKWTDFVIRVRFNPFTTSTNPSGSISGAANQTYSGNAGILQIWKSVGSSRTMTLVMNRVNQPVGLVPQASLLNQFKTIFSAYKYGWKKNTTTVDGPIFVGFDEMFFGQAVRDETGYEDVLP